MSQVYNLLNLIFEQKGANSQVWESLKNVLQNQSNEIEPFCFLIKNRINSGNNADILLALNILDYAVDYGRLLLWETIDKKNFLESIINILKSKPDIKLHNTSLYLIQKWSLKFKNYPSIRNCKNAYNALKNTISFPINISNSYLNYISQNNLMNNNINNNMNNNINNNFTFGNSNNNNMNNNNNNIMNMNFNNNMNNINYDLNNINNINNKIINNKNIEKNHLINKNPLRLSRVPSNPSDYIDNIHLDLNVNNYPKKYHRLLVKLYEWTHSIQEINVLIDNNINFQNNIQLNKLCADLKNGNDQLIRTIQGSKLKDEKLMEISLNVSEDILMTLDRYEKSKKMQSPGPFLTSFLRDDNPNKKNETKLTGIEKNDFKDKDPREKIKYLGFGDSINTKYIEEDNNNIDFNNSNINLSGLFDKSNKTMKLDMSQNTNVNDNNNNMFTSMSMSNSNISIDDTSNYYNNLNNNVNDNRKNDKDLYRNLVGDNRVYERIADNNDIKRLISKSHVNPSTFMNINNI